MSGVVRTVSHVHATVLASHVHAVILTSQAHATVVGGIGRGRKGNRHASQKLANHDHSHEHSAHHADEGTHLVGCAPLRNPRAGAASTGVRRPAAGGTGAAPAGSTAFVRTAARQRRRSTDSREPTAAALLLPPARLMVRARSLPRALARWVRACVMLL